MCSSNLADHLVWHVAGLCLAGRCHSQLLGIMAGCGVEAGAWCGRIGAFPAREEDAVQADQSSAPVSGVNTAGERVPVLAQDMDAARGRISLRSKAGPLGRLAGGAYGGHEEELPDEDSKAIHADPSQKVVKAFDYTMGEVLVGEVQRQAPWPPSTVPACASPTPSLPCCPVVRPRNTLQHLWELDEARQAQWSAPA